MKPTDRKARDAALAVARRRALTELANLHHAEFAILYDSQCLAMGVEPAGDRPNGRPPS